MNSPPKPMVSITPGAVPRFEDDGSVTISVRDAAGEDIEFSFPYATLSEVSRLFHVATFVATDRLIALGKVPQQLPRSAPMLVENVNVLTQAGSNDLLLEILGRRAPEEPPGSGSIQIPDRLVDQTIYSLRSARLRQRGQVMQAPQASPPVDPLPPPKVPKPRRVAQKKTRSRSVAKNYILTLALDGNHYNPSWQLMTENDLEQHFVQHGLPLTQVVESARQVEYQVPALENLVSEGLWTSFGGGEVGIGLPSGEVKPVISGEGVFTGKLYIHAAEVSQQHLSELVKSQNIADLRTAIERSVDSVDQYLTYRAELWNSANPQQSLTDSSEAKVSTQDKVSRWVPQMLNGRRLQSERAWQGFLALKRIRDDFIVHPKTALMGLTFEEMATRANDIRTGPARLLLDLHVLFGEPAPAAIIKGAYRPDFIVDVDQ